MLQTYRLKNGIKVATYSIPEMKSAFLSVVAKGGSFFDTERTQGTAHFMEHLLVQGIPSFPNVEGFSDYIEGLAGSYGAWTDFQTIRFTLNAPARYLKDMVGIANEVFFQPLFPPDSVERERQAVLEEIRQRQDALWYKNYQFFAKVRYKPSHPMRLDGGGSINSVKNLTREDLLKFWEKFFYPKNTNLVIVGGVNNSETRKVVEHFFGKVKSNKSFPGFPEFTNLDMSSRKVAIREDPELKSCYIDLTFPSASDEILTREHIPQTLIKYIMGRLRGSRLFRLLRQRKGLVYDVGISSGSYPHFGYVDIYCQTSVEKLEEVIDLIAKELASFRKGGPTKSELEFAKSYGINRVLMAFDHPSGIAEWIEGGLLWEERVYTPEEFADLIKAVKMEDIMSFMKKYWEFDKLNLVVQGPVKNDPANLKKFKEIISVI